ncbi:MAG: hypothetical protein IJG85_01405 [Eubacteriaceae bacterium]|nr:hypothetical protein [Eubacteriaceae bacterium]
MKKLFSVLTVVILIMLCCSSAAMAQSTQVSQEGSGANHDTAGNVFKMDSSAEIQGEKCRDAFLMGKDVIVKNCDVSGNLFAGAQNLKIDTIPMIADIFGMGQNVEIANVKDGGNAFLMGDTITVKGSNFGSILTTGSVSDINADCSALTASGNVVAFNGKLNGDGAIEASKVIIGQDTVINGKLMIRSENEPEIAAGVNKDKISYEKVITKGEDPAERQAAQAQAVTNAIMRGLFWIVAVFLIGLVITLVFRKNAEEAIDMFMANKGRYILIGLLVWICAPIVIMALCFTLIGMPLAVLLLLAYLFFTCIGVAFTASSVTRLILPKLHPVLSMLIGVAVLVIVGMLPYIGWIVGVACSIYVFGYVSQKFAEWFKEFKPQKKQPEQIKQESQEQ